MVSGFKIKMNQFQIVENAHNALKTFVIFLSYKTFGLKSLKITQLRLVVITLSNMRVSTNATQQRQN